jgi:hypothetical protein
MTELAGVSEFSASRVAVAVLAAAALCGLVVLRPLSDRAPEQDAAKERDLVLDG